MSLEAAIRENTAALQALTATLRVSVPGPAVEAVPVQSRPVPTESGQAPAVDTPAEPAALDYEKDVKPAVLKLAAQSRDALRGLLAKYGAAKGPEVPAEKLAAFLADVQAAT